MSTTSFAFSETISESKVSETFHSPKYDGNESYNNEEEIIIEKEKVSLWEEIIEEFQKEKKLLKEWQRENEATKIMVPHQDGPVDYLNREIFPILLPAIEDLLLRAKQENALKIQKCRFNPIDYLAEALWNKNPRHPERNVKWLDIFNIPVFKNWLKKYPRQIYPKSCIWTEDEAAIRIQRWFRAWLVKKQEDIKNMEQRLKETFEEYKEFDEEDSREFVNENIN